MYLLSATWIEVTEIVYTEYAKHANFTENHADGKT